VLEQRLILTVGRLAPGQGKEYLHHRRLGDGVEEGGLDGPGEDTREHIGPEAEIDGDAVHQNPDARQQQGVGHQKAQPGKQGGKQPVLRHPGEVTLMHGESLGGRCPSVGLSGMKVPGQQGLVIPAREKTGQTHGVVAQPGRIGGQLGAWVQVRHVALDLANGLIQFEEAAGAGETLGLPAPGVFDLRLAAGQGLPAFLIRQQRELWNIDGVQPGGAELEHQPGEERKADDRPDGSQRTGVPRQRAETDQGAGPGQRGQQIAQRHAQADREPIQDIRHGFFDGPHGRHLVKVPHDDLL